MKILICLITKGMPNPQSYESILVQDYPHYDWMMSGVKPVDYHLKDFGETPPPETYNKRIYNLYNNCVANRNILRKMALTSDADYFLFMDDDIILPRDALSKMIMHKKDIMGGWYKMENSTNYVAGAWVADHIFIHYQKPQEHVIKVDTIGMGCALLSRKVVEAVPFEVGLDRICKDAQENNLLLGECGIFGERAIEKGFMLFMTGDVICGHIKNGVII